MSLSAKEVNQLRSLLAKVSVSNPTPQASKKKRRRRRRGAATSSGTNIPAGYTRGTNPSGVGATQGEIVVSRSELIGSVAATAAGNDTGQIKMYPDSTSFSWLHKLRQAFDRIEWMQATIHYKPFVGTNTAGSVCFGVDWNSSVTSLNRAKVQSMTPVFEAPIWQAGKLPLPGRYLMTRKVYLLESTNDVDKMPGIICWALAGTSAKETTTYGELWVTYKVRLSGTTS